MGMLVKQLENGNLEKSLQAHLDALCLAQSRALISLLRREKGLSCTLFFLALNITLVVAFIYLSYFFLFA